MPTTAIPQKWLTPDQVARLLQVDRLTVYRWLKEGVLKGYRLNKRSLRIWWEDLAQFIREAPDARELPRKDLL